MVNLNYLKNFKRDCLVLKDSIQGIIGYTEYTPWPELDQISCEQMLEQVTKDPEHFLREKIQADATRWQKLRKENLPFFKNHSFSMSDTQINISENKIKIKLSGQVKVDKSKIKLACSTFGSIRLDANYRYKKNDFKLLFSQLKEHRKQIEYVEDPVTWDKQAYQQFLKEDYPIALDQPFNVLGQSLDLDCPYIYKPSLRKISDCNKNFIFSSNFGHPLGLWQNYCELLENGDLDLTHGIYCPDLYDSWNSPFNIRDGKVYICKSILNRTYAKLRELNWNKI